VAVATAVFAAAVWTWDRATPADTRVASLAFALTTVVTGAALWRTELRQPGGARARLALAAGLAAFDLGLATAVVHLTGGGASQFAALYVLAIAGAGLALPFGGAVLAGLAGCALYACDVLWWRPGPSAPLSLGLQLGTFALVAVAAGGLGARLRAAGAGGEALARALARARGEAADVLRDMTSGVVTVDADGRLLYANAAPRRCSARRCGRSWDGRRWRGWRRPRPGWPRRSRGRRAASARRAASRRWRGPAGRGRSA
jgi:two-component system sensor histidine kinase PilS (NtrC family)